MRDIYASKIGLLTAVHTIKAECEKHDECCRCPFIDPEDDFECGIQYPAPVHWDIIDINDSNDSTIWRVFK